MASASRPGNPPRLPPTHASSRPISAKPMTALLRIEELEVAYGDMVAVRDVTLEVHAGQIVCLIGGNGAGKTTTLRAVSGLLRPRRGTVSLEGDRIDRLSP